MAKFVLLHLVESTNDGKGTLAKGKKMVVNIEQVFAVVPFSADLPHTQILSCGNESVNVFESFEEVDRIISGALR